MDNKNANPVGGPLFMPKETPRIKKTYLSGDTVNSFKGWET